MIVSRRDVLGGTGALLVASQAGAMTAKPVAERQFVVTATGGRNIRISEWKRHQAAPGPKVSRRALGRERRYPISSGWT